MGTKVGVAVAVGVAVLRDVLKRAGVSEVSGERDPNVGVWTLLPQLTRIRENINTK